MYVEVTSPDLRLTLRGLVLRNGAALVNLDLGDTAGAIYFRPPGGVLTVEACAFESNRALFLGGAIRTKNTADLPLAIITLIVRDSTFDQNSAAFGGAISTGTRTTFTVERSVFTRNLAVANADTGGFSSGGAISSGGTQLRMSGTTLDANVAGLGSGALDLFSTCPFDFGPDEPFQQTTTAEISASVFKANSAGADASADLIGLGGAVGVFGCNYAEPAQGVAVPRTMLRLSESAFEANVAVGADSYGGAVATGYGVSTLVLSTACKCPRNGYRGPSARADASAISILPLQLWPTATRARPTARCTSTLSRRRAMAAATRCPCRLR
jgi:predicted outer membrane repeat protein